MPVKWSRGKEKKPQKKPKKRVIVAVICTFLLFGIVVLTGCSSTSIGVDVPFENTAWILERYGTTDDMKSVLRGTRITAVFFSSNKMVRGSGGCNTYGGHYDIISSDGLKIEELVSTEILCNESVNKQENAYLEILANAMNFQVDHNTLTINSPEGTLVFKP